MLNKHIVVDSNVLVALVSSRDSLHERAVALIHACEIAQTELVYLDCVLSETLSVLGRRTEEQGRSDEFSALVDSLLARAPESSIVWLSQYTRRLYADVVNLMRMSKGRLNFNDCLVAIGCRELGLDTIASFDPDFDDIAWLHRVSSADSMQVR
jgi:predicted nucleic acid-binding protein